MELDRKAYHKEYNKKYYALNRTKERERKKDYWKKYAYNLDPIGYAAMLQFQDFKCKICGIENLNLHVDHDHKTGIIRGLLCRNCNVGLSYIEKDGFIEKCKEYLDGDWHN